MDTLDQILEALKEMGQKVGVIGTVNDDCRPQSSSVFFTYDKKINIYFMTRANSVKYRNLLRNPSISFVAYTEKPPKTVQVEGTATLVSDPKEQNEVFPELLKVATENGAPPVSLMMESELMLMKITPSWARLGNFAKNKNNN